MEWLKATAIMLALFVAVDVAQGLFEPILRPFGRALRRFYTPPHGAAALVATWAAAIGAFWAAFNVGAEWAGLAAVLALGGPFAAFLATLVYRDLRRESRGLPPVITELPANVPAALVNMLGARKRATKAICSFCGKTEAADRRIIAGPSVWICQQCVAAAQHTLEGWQPGEPRGLYGVPPTNVTHCSFCGSSRAEVPGFVTARASAICGECVVVTEQMLADGEIAT